MFERSQMRHAQFDKNRVHILFIFKNIIVL